MLQNAYFLAKFGFDTAENEPGRRRRLALGRAGRCRRLRLGPPNLLLSARTVQINQNGLPPSGGRIILSACPPTTCMYFFLTYTQVETHKNAFFKNIHTSTLLFELNLLQRLYVKISPHKELCNVSRCINIFFSAVNTHGQSRK